MPHVTHGPITVIRHDFDQYRDAAGGIALVSELFHVIGIVSAGTSGNGAVDGVALHVCAQCLIYSSAQSRIILCNGPTRASGDHQFTDQFGK